jgi:hypothetical protein
VIWLEWGITYTHCAPRKRCCIRSFRATDELAMISTLFFKLTRHDEDKGDGEYDEVSLMDVVAFALLLLRDLPRDRGLKQSEQL